MGAACKPTADAAQPDGKYVMRPAVILHRMGRWPVRATSGAIAALVLSATVAAGQPPSPQSDSVTGFPGFLTGVSATSASNVWAAGWYRIGQGPQKTVLAHWNGTSWTRVPSPNPGVDGSLLDSVSADSASDAWAVGNTSTSDGSSNGLALHWNGTRWGPVPVPGAIPVLEAVSADSSSDAWAVGTQMIAHWDGTRWTRMTTSAIPSGGFLNSVSALSPSDVWVAGQHFVGMGVQPLVLHWNGTSWQRITVPDPTPGQTELWGVSARSAADAWFVGDYQNHGTHHPGLDTLTLHWNGSRVTQVPSPSPSGAAAPASPLLGVAAISASGAFAVGASNNASLGENTLALHWNGTKWIHTPTPTPGEPVQGAQLNAVSAVSSSDAWAVGYISGSPAKGLILHWNGTTWQRS